MVSACRISCLSIAPYLLEKPCSRDSCVLYLGIADGVMNISDVGEKRFQLFETRAADRALV